MESFMVLCGWALILGGALTGAGWGLFAWVDPTHAQHEHTRWAPLNMLIIGGGGLMALGQPGLFLYHADAAGWLGLLGFVVLFVGIMVPYLVVHSIETATPPNSPPIIRRFIAVGAPSLFVGLILTGAAMLRAGVYPTGLGVLFIAAPLIGILTVTPRVPAWLGRNLASLPFSLAMIWAGWVLLAAG